MAFLKIFPKSPGKVSINTGYESALLWALPLSVFHWRQKKDIYASAAMNVTSERL